MTNKEKHSTRAFFIWISRFCVVLGPGGQKIISIWFLVMGRLVGRCSRWLWHGTAAGDGSDDAHHSRLFICLYRRFFGGISSMCRRRCHSSMRQISMALLEHIVEWYEFQNYFAFYILLCIFWETGSQRKH